MRHSGNQPLAEHPESDADFSSLWLVQSPTKNVPRISSTVEAKKKTMASIFRAEAVADGRLFESKLRQTRSRNVVAISLALTVWRAH